MKKRNPLTLDILHDSAIASQVVYTSTLSIIEMTEEQKCLPNEILLKSTISGKEYGWKRENLHEVVNSAVKAGLAVVGGQVQIKLPNGTCELYWRKYDTNERMAGEGWTSYCSRTNRECLEQINALPTNQELINEGIENFEFLREKSAQGVNLEDFLIFILYFNAPEKGN